MEFLKEIKSSLLIMAGFYIIIGLVMLFAPNFVSNSLCYLIGAICIIVGGLSIYTYIGSDVYGTLAAAFFIIAAVFIGSGLFIILNPEIVVSFIPIIMGVLLVIDAFGKLQTASRLHKYNYDKWWYVLISALVIFVFGILLLFNPFEAITLFIRVVGIFLLIDGISNIITVFSYKQIEKEIK